MSKDIKKVAIFSAVVVLVTLLSIVLMSCFPNNVTMFNIRDVKIGEFIETHYGIEVEEAERYATYEIYPSGELELVSGDLTVEEIKELPEFEQACNKLMRWGTRNYTPFKACRAKIKDIEEELIFYFVFGNVYASIDGVYATDKDYVYVVGKAERAKLNPSVNFFFHQ